MSDSGRVDRKDLSYFTDTRWKLYIRGVLIIKKAGPVSGTCLCVGCVLFLSWEETLLAELLGDLNCADCATKRSGDVFAF